MRESAGLKRQLSRCRRFKKNNGVAWPLLSILCCFCGLFVSDHAWTSANFTFAFLCTSSFWVYLFFGPVQESVPSAISYFFSRILILTLFYTLPPAQAKSSCSHQRLGIVTCPKAQWQIAARSLYLIGGRGAVEHAVDFAKRAQWDRQRPRAYGLANV